MVRARRAPLEPEPLHDFIDKLLWKTHQTAPVALPGMVPLGVSFGTWPPAGWGERTEVTQIGANTTLYTMIRNYYRDDLRPIEWIARAFVTPWAETTEGRVLTASVSYSRTLPDEGQGRAERPVKETDAGIAYLVRPKRKSERPFWRFTTDTNHRVWVAAREAMSVVEALAGT